MPWPVRCPKCNHLGKVPKEFLGLRVRCKKCSHPFEANLDLTATPKPQAVQQPSARGSKPVPPAPLFDDDATVALEDLDLVLPPLPVTATKPPPVVHLPAIPKPPPGNFGTQVEDATKSCPFCGESILAMAKKCKHCGELLPSISAMTPSVPAPAPAQAPSVVLVGTGPRPVGFHCPFCNTAHAPLVRKKTSTGGWIFFWVLILFLCWPICWVGLLFKDEYRVCSNCGMKLG